MCGRFTLRTPAEIWLPIFNLPIQPDIPPRYNVAPTQLVSAIRHDGDGNRSLACLRWGLIPSWAKDKSIGNRMINARGETVADKPSFRGPFRSKRCLIVADGFFEWKKTPEGKQPVYICLQDERPFAFAGLWDRWEGGETIESCTVITTDANELLQPVHDRMPVILAGDDCELWLASDVPGSDERKKAELLDLLRPFPADAMKYYPVSKLVNSPGNEQPACVTPLAV